MNRLFFRLAVGVLSAVFLVHTATTSVRAADSTVTARLNGLDLVFDAGTGGLVRMSHAAVGTMLQADRRQAGIVAVACPNKADPRLRLAPWRSTGARIEKTGDRVVIRWDRLATTSPESKISGSVAATVTFQSAPDGRSAIVQCRIENRSQEQIVQIVFPDLIGLVPVHGADQTDFHSGGVAVKPFLTLTPSHPDPIVGKLASYTAGGYYSPMVIRWLDLGSHRGGLSLFPRDWGLQPPMTVLLHLWETTKTLRLMVAHSVHLTRGAAWESPTYWLTPHEAGWAKGIEPYREWVREKVNRVAPIPEHIRRGLGFRTVWMCRAWPLDPEDALFRFGDLPKLAREAKEHGLDEMVLWFTHHAFELPLPPFFEHLGGGEELVKSVAECKRLGVNVVPFISVCNAKEKTAANYGLKVGNSGWTYHPELVPRFNPPYAGAYRCAQVLTRHPLWQKDVLASCKRLVDMGIPSLCWDQYFVEMPEPNLLTLTRQIRAYSRNHDPQSSFSAEELSSMEIAGDYLDYTWNWCARRDLSPATSVFPAPRLNLNVDNSAEDVKTAFLQNAYVNVQPRRPDDINGSDWIANHPEVSRSLRQCAALRKRFLDYFVDGRLVGDCLLAKDCEGAMVGGYVLGGRALLIVLNTSGKKRSFDLELGLAPFVVSNSGKYRALFCDGLGRPVSESIVSGSGRLTTPLLDHLELAIWELGLP
jgi:hypothetical protein